MSEIEKGEARAFGAFQNMIEQMKASLEREGRSPEYVSAFFDNLRNVASDYAEELF